MPIDLLCSSTLSNLDLRWNKFSGPFLLPCYNSSQNVRYIDLSFNDISRLLLENIDLSFPMLRFSIMIGNKLEGQIPTSLGHAQLYLLDLSVNDLSGKLPHTLTRNHFRLSYLNVLQSLHQLEGQMLPFDANMPNLRIFVVNNNDFLGSFLLRLSNSSRLQLIDAGNNSFIDNLSHNLPYFPQMIILSLRNN